MTEMIPGETSILKETVYQTNIIRSITMLFREASRISILSISRQSFGGREEF
jgi:hypothetical protein